MEMTQYQKDLVRMWDSLRDKHKDTTTCISVNCGACPLQDCCCGNNGNISFNSEKAIEIVTQWAKEHPIVTRADKFKKVFGVEPNDIICPHSIGFTDVKCVNEMCHKECKKCKEEFWGSEYKEPAKEGVSE